jgi:hypothetical protein
MLKTISWLYSWHALCVSQSWLIYYKRVGLLSRTCGGEPELTTHWLGRRRIMTFAAGTRFAREAHAY